VGAGCVVGAAPDAPDAHAAASTAVKMVRTLRPADRQPLSLLMVASGIRLFMLLASSFRKDAARRRNIVYAILAPLYTAHSPSGKILKSVC
jgi:hypothetical protein